MKIKTSDFSYIIVSDNLVRWIHCYLNKKDVWVKINDNSYSIKPNDVYFNVKKIGLNDYLLYCSVPDFKREAPIDILLKDLHISYRGKEIPFSETLKFKNMKKKISESCIVVYYKGIRKLNLVYEN